MNKIICFLLWMGLFVCCSPASDIEKFQSKRDNIVNVHDRIIEIEMEEVPISNVSWLYSIGDYLIIPDYKSLDELIHLFDKKTFTHCASITYRGQGPNEIANFGFIGVDEVNRRFYVTDLGKYQVLGYSLDSVLTNPDYTPEVVSSLETTQFPVDFHYINDTLSIGLIMVPTGNSGFNLKTAKWNMKTGEISQMRYTHPDIERKRVCMAVSEKNGIYVECYMHHDLLSICSLDGELKHNVYFTKNWDTKTSNRIGYFKDVAFCKDKIVASYMKRDYFNEGEPTAFLVFDLEGNYLMTIETGYEICDFCYDKENDRIVMRLNNDIQFAYLDLDGVI